MTKEYNEIKVLKGLSGVRSNVGMYLGNTHDGSAIQQSLLEIISNSVDEFMSGYATKIKVCLYKDGSAEIEDNGRGIPVSYNNKENVSNLELALTKLHAGGKFSGSKNYNTSGGLHGVGAACTNAISIRLRATVWRDGNEYTMAFQKGEKVEEISKKPVRRKQTGTSIRFAIDRSLFKNVFEFNSKEIYNKLKEFSYLCQGLVIEYIDEKNNIRETMTSNQGLSDFVKDLAPASLLGDPIYITTNGYIGVDIALQWLDNGRDETIDRYYTNNIHNLDGGSHMVGFRAGLTRTINSYISKSDISKSLKVSLSGDDVREGIVAVISVKHPNPSYSSQTKNKLVSEDVRTAVETTIGNKLYKYLEQNPNISKKIVTQCVNAYKAREAARKAREATRKSVFKDGSVILPGKLADCSSKDPEECELFIVEGNSAGGSIKSGRDRRFQAILPLRGKVLNVEKCDFRKILINKEIQNIITALGCGIGKNFNINKLRYHKVICTMDADVDGSHIRALIMTFIYRQMPQLITNGHIYIAQPPLFKLVYRGKNYYFKNKKELQKHIEANNLGGKNLTISRNKGLGEMMPQELWETTVNPENRELLRVHIENFVRTDRLFNILMGKDIELRKKFIIDNCEFANNLDI